MKEFMCRSEHLLKTLTDFMPGMVGFWSKDLRSTFANRRYSDWFGKSPEEMKGIRIQDLLGDDLFRKNEPYINAALAGKVQEFERTLIRHDGEQIETLFYYIPYQDDSGIQGFFTLVLDITERKHLEQVLMSLAEECQRSMGRELHDSLGQELAAMGYQSRALEKKLLASGDTDSAHLAASIADQAHSAVMHCKQLAQSMLPFELEANGLAAALQSFASRIVATYEIACDFVYPNEITIDDVNIALNLYRIAQEAVNNAIRHSGARRLTILLDLQEDLLRLAVCDDGCGFTGIDTKSGSGMGIKIMRHRAMQLGATLEFLPRAEGGTEVCIEMRME